jgi:hypothetical protein
LRVSAISLSFTSFSAPPGRDVSVDELEHPFDRFDDHRLHLGSVPVGFDVAERGIEDASLAVHLGPRDREVAVLAMNARVGEVQLRRIEPHQYARRRSREVLDLIDLVVDRER